MNYILYYIIGIIMAAAIPLPVSHLLDKPVQIWWFIPSAIWIVFITWLTFVWTAK